MGRGGGVPGPCVCLFIVCMRNLIGLECSVFVTCTCKNCKRNLTDTGGDRYNLSRCKNCKRISWVVICTCESCTSMTRHLCML